MAVQISGREEPARVFHGDPPRLVSSETDAGIPFFGIVPRALMQDAASKNCREWFAIAGSVEASRRTRPAAMTGAPPYWLARHDDAEVASWESSCNACTSYLSRLLRSEPLRRRMPDLPSPSAQWDVWQIKEGHTSSVWRAAAATEGGSRRALCINIARDTTASIEMQCCAELLMRWHERDPVHIAPVYSVDSIDVRHGLKAFSLTASAGPWIDGHELHLERDHDALRLIEVDHFLQDGLDGPQSIAGRRLSVDDTCALLRQWQRLVIRHAAACPGRASVLAPHFDFADGDLISSGRRLVAIACNADCVAVPTDIWVAFTRITDPFDAYRYLDRACVGAGGS